MRLKWFVWKYILSFAAQSQGFPDPIGLVERLNRFAQPSEVLAPLELIRAGALFQARGLINSQVIQHNLDWVWPYWAERQFDPLDASFIPRAFSLSHTNLTHRNWTATGLPGDSNLILVDPRGLVTPFHNSWSIDCWIISNNVPVIVPSKMKEVIQQVSYELGHSIDSNFFYQGNQLQQRVYLEITDAKDADCCIDYLATLNQHGTVIITVRPYNPEGISFIHSIHPVCSQQGMIINKSNLLHFESLPEKMIFSNYRSGDVFHHINSDVSSAEKGIYCSAGLATGAALFPVQPGKPVAIKLRIPLTPNNIYTIRKSVCSVSGRDRWKNVLNNTCTCVFPYKRYQELFEAAVHTLLLHSSDTVYAGPFTYKRFWFRDTAFILQSLLFMGKIDQCGKIVESFFRYQKPDGYFQSQEGEWDSNGQVLWSLLNYCECAGLTPQPQWQDSIRKAALWITNKRIKNRRSSFYGLLPSGFSAEHLGPNDYYYWDDFWGVAGLFSASTLIKMYGNNSLSVDFRTDGLHFLKTLLSSITRTVTKKIMPSSPNRRPDSSAVGSLVSSYPLQLLSPGNQYITATSNYLFENCCINNALYHDISHSGINPYLSLHIAQSFLRNFDSRYAFIADAICTIASPTGQWPEAVHPQLGTGCMGDGQHIWAAAEWMMIMKNIFIREETNFDIVYLCSGIIRDHLLTCKTLSIGPVVSRYGVFTISIQTHADFVEVQHSCKPGKKVAQAVYVSLCNLPPVQVSIEHSTTRFSFDDLDL
ncbi:MAG TPA: hypothetical protein VHO70_20935 [Chitinispirillaceae bacterium]|nr:hypothetical protein [Chitinispirillaceae bacterium]